MQVGIKFDLINYHFKLEFVYSGLYFEIILYIRCYRQDPDPMKKVMDPEGQKSHTERCMNSKMYKILNI